MAGKVKYYQIEAPSPTDQDPHPSLTVDGEAIPCGYVLTVLLPGGWKRTALELDWNKKDSNGWYFSINRDISPIGVFCKWD